MFITIKINKNKIYLFITILLIASIVGGFGYKILNNIGFKETSIDIDNNLNTKIVEFVESYGWRLDKQPIESEEFIIPNQFNEIYTRYNQYQLEIGKDLRIYKGKNVRRYVYKITNYDLMPQFEGQQVYADIIIHQNDIIGADLKTNQINGFMVSINNKTFKEITGKDEYEYN